MQENPNIARIGALIGDNARASMLAALMHGKALTASELAREAGITAQTASTHLARLETGGLLSVRKQGRHKYFALNGEPVANLLESMMSLAGTEAVLKTRTGPRDHNLRQARVCYNHLAGDRGIQMYDALVTSRHLVLDQGQLHMSAAGEDYLIGFGIDIPALKRGKSPLCRECLDWSERRSHLAGSLGRALLARMESLRWVKRVPGSRVLKFSPRGLIQFEACFSR